MVSPKLWRRPVAKGPTSARPSSRLLRPPSISRKKRLQFFCRIPFGKPPAPNRLRLRTIGCESFPQKPINQSSIVMDVDHAPPIGRPVKSIFSTQDFNRWHLQCQVTLAPTERHELGPVASNLRKHLSSNPTSAVLGCLEPKFAWDNTIPSIRKGGKTSSNRPCGATCSFTRLPIRRSAFSKSQAGFQNPHSAIEEDRGR